MHCRPWTFHPFVDAPQPVMYPAQAAISDLGNWTYGYSQELYEDRCTDPICFWMLKLVYKDMPMHEPDAPMNVSWQDMGLW